MCSSLALSASRLALVIQDGHSQGQGLPRETSGPKHTEKSVGVERKEENVRCDLTVSFI